MENLKAARTAKGYTQEKLSKIIGVSRSAVAVWETGDSQPDNNTLATLADILDVTTDYLLGREDSPNLPYDPDTVAAMEEAFDRPEMRALFSVSKNATREDIEKTIAIIKALKGDDYAE